MKENGLSVRQAAKKIGISYGYLSRIMTGKSRPDVRVCIALADAFGDPRVDILRYAGWLEDATGSTEIERMVKDDPLLCEALKAFLQIDSKRDREMLLRLAKAVFSIGEAQEARR